MMTDRNASLRDLVTSWAGTDHSTSSTISGVETEGIEACPRSHSRETALDSDGVKGEERRQERPLTPAMADATNPATTLNPGDVVRWTSHRISGLGQIETLTPAAATIRTWHPCRTRTVTVALHRITPIPALTHTLTAILTTPGDLQ